MQIPSIYINLEDDVSKIVARIKKERSGELILVCPKRCFLFNDAINLRLLKKQVDMLSKKVHILTMDERGQAYAKEAGFELKDLPKARGNKSFSDIRVSQKQPAKILEKKSEDQNPVTKAVLGIQNLAHSLIDSKPEEKPKTESASSAEEYFSKISEEKFEDKVNSPVSHKQTESIFPADLENSYKNKKQKKRLKLITGIFAVCALALVFFVVFIFLPRAEVIIYAKTQNLTRDLVISLSSHAEAANSESLILPAQKISQSVSAKLSFQSQGKKEIGNKASGKVVIYNFTGAPLNLKAKTTTVILNGKNYLLKSDAMQIKPTRYKNSQTKEIDESSLSAPVEIEAETGGESYNVPAGTRLEVTNQVFGSRPQLLYVKASTAITGGTTRYLSVISNEDIEAAKAALQKEALNQISSQLNSNKLVIQEKAFQLLNPEFKFNHEIGTETPEFSGTLTGLVLGFAYNSEGLNNLVLERIKKSLTAEQEIEIQLRLPLSVAVKTTDFNQELVVLEVHFEGMAIAQNKNLESLPKKLAGKTQSSAAEYIKQNMQAEKVEITLLPGWQKWLPWLSNNIHISLK
jgi:hypothetical protein